MSRSLLRAVLVALLAVLVAAPSLGYAETNRHKYLVLHSKVEKHHGKKAAGRNAVHDGLRRLDGTTRDVRQSDYKRLLRPLRRLLAPAPRYLSQTAGPPPNPPAGTMTATARVTSAPLAGIRACESHGNYSAVSPGGTYRGAYQFDSATWAEVGGTGDPAQASPAEQDKRAAMLYARAGAGRWPVCGR